MYIPRKQKVVLVMHLASHKPNIQINSVVENYVGWRTLSSIFSNVLVSPWNILVGGILISKLSFVHTTISIVLGYAILALIFSFYGGLGYTTRSDTSELIEPVFGKQGTKMFFSAVLALGQIGWFAIITQIGGESLAVLIGSTSTYGIILYGLAMCFMAGLKLYHFGLLKALINISSISLILYLLAVSTSSVETSQLLTKSSNSESIIWGISIIVASLLSFLSVSPDFFSQAKERKDVGLSVIFGIFLPGVVVTTVGALIFINATEISIAALIGFSAIALFGHIFNSITNSDAAIAIYTPGKRFSYMFDIPFRWGLLAATAIGILLATANIASHMETWLTLLAGVYPGIIGVTVARYTLERYGIDFRDKNLRTNWRAIGIILGCSALIFVINVTLLHWIVGVASFTLYTLATCVEIRIYFAGKRIR